MTMPRPILAVSGGSDSGIIEKKRIQRERVKPRPPKRTAYVIAVDPAGRSKNTPRRIVDAVENATRGSFLLLSLSEIMPMMMQPGIPMMVPALETIPTSM